MAEVSLVRLYILRAMYAVLGFAEGSIQLQAFLHQPHWTLTSGVVHSFLAALATLSLVGIFYPLRMLPLLMYELLWKSIWLLGIALPLWLSNQFDPNTRQTFYECIGVVILIPIIPWRYVFRGPADPWWLGGRPKAIVAAAD
ncbi:MAG TPA: hypothetical protein VHU18_12085 [Rhizomicrobium sp.]|jgi:hypothetical protein|nr:hypothetical protein [Rhizomicrobium sp.]